MLRQMISRPKIGAFILCAIKLKSIQVKVIFSAGARIIESSSKNSICENFKPVVKLN